jgi:hypothetical protein
VSSARLPKATDVGTFDGSACVDAGGTREVYRARDPKLRYSSDADDD